MNRCEMLNPFAASRFHSSPSLQDATASGPAGELLRPAANIRPRLPLQGAISWEDLSAVLKTKAGAVEYGGARRRCKAIARFRANETLRAAQRQATVRFGDSTSAPTRPAGGRLFYLLRLGN